MAELVKFTEKTIDYAKNPRNQGDMENPTAIGEVSNPDCGDSTIIYLKVEDNIIKDVTFETFGCAAAVASSSMLTEMIKGKTIEEAYAMTEEAVAEESETTAEETNPAEEIKEDSKADNNRRTDNASYI